MRALLGCICFSNANELIKKKAETQNKSSYIKTLIPTFKKMSSSCLKSLAPPLCFPRGTTVDWFHMNNSLNLDCAPCQLIYMCLGNEDQKSGDEKLIQRSRTVFRTGPTSAGSCRESNYKPQHLKPPVTLTTLKLVVQQHPHHPHLSFLASQTAG